MKVELKKEEKNIVKLEIEIPAAEAQKEYDLNYEFCPFKGNKVDKATPLFPRLDSKVETEYISSLAQNK